MTAVKGADAKAALLARHLPEDDVVVPLDGVDVTVRVRGLSREETLSLSDDPDVTYHQIEVQMLTLGFVDPQMTEAEVIEWRKGGLPDEVRTVVRRIEELSGLRKETAKETWKEMESDPDAEFRDVPRDEAGDDSGPPPS